jgi:Zn-dependent protease
MAILMKRMLGAATLDASTYEKVEADAATMPQAILVVLLASVADGAGAFRGMGIGGIVLAAFASLLGWFVWALITFVVGTRLLPGARTQADVGQLLRTIGFSAAPGLIRVLTIIPGLHGPISVVASLWMLAAMVVAVRQALDYQSTGRAVLVCLIGFVLNYGLLFALGNVLGVTVVVAP